MINPNDMRHTLAGFATGLVAVAAEIDGDIVGMPVNSLVSVSLDPPLVALSFAHTSTTWPVLRQARCWGISILAEGLALEILALVILGFSARSLMSVSSIATIDASPRPDRRAARVHGSPVGEQGARPRRRPECRGAFPARALPDDVGDHERHEPLAELMVTPTLARTPGSRWMTGGCRVPTTRQPIRT